MSSNRRDLTDLKAIAAMSHPLRRRLMDILTVDGPSTASMLAERTEQAVGNISHHVRVLADCGLVEEAPELARQARAVVAAGEQQRPVADAQPARGARDRGHRDGGGPHQTRPSGYGCR